MFRSLISVLFILYIPIRLIPLKAQDYPFSEQSYNFVRYDKNKITFPGDSSQFEKLFFKLDNIIKTGEGKINIIHIGGSHIQAGIYSGVVREKLQTFYPGLNGGRGLIFPYKMSKTNNPKNYRISWTGNWATCRNVDKKNCDLGLLGISATCMEKNAQIEIKLSENYIPYDFNSIKIFNKIGETYYKVEPINISSSYSVEEFPENGYTLISSETYLKEISFKLIQTDTIQKEFVLYGISLDNEDSGVVYIDAGINGSKIPSFLDCNLLEQQTQTINPDLVILSLGTNDTYTTHFSTETYYRNYKQLIKTIKRASPNTAILITVPNDSYYKRKYPNGNTALAEKEINRLAKEFSCGVWNFYTVMGGYNSSYLWYKEKLMHTDLIHFSKKGYILKGELMFEAIINAYDKHIINNRES